MTVATRFYCRSGRAAPSRRVSKIPKPRIQRNPAGIHLKSAGRCPNNRCQFYRHRKFFAQFRYKVITGKTFVTLKGGKDDDRVMA